MTQVAKGHAGSTVTADVEGNVEHGLLYCSKKIVVPGSQQEPLLSALICSEHYSRGTCDMLAYDT